MLPMRPLFATALVASSSTAFTQSGSLFFNNPGDLESIHVNSPVTLTYSAPSLDDGVTIVLRQGDPNNLAIVQTLTGSATGGEFAWTPSIRLHPDVNYALQLIQGTQIGYSQGFAIAAEAAVSTATSTTDIATASTSTPAVYTSSNSQLSSLASLISSYNASLAYYTSTTPSSFPTLQTTTTNASTTAAAAAYSTASDSNRNGTALSSIVPTIDNSTTTAATNNNVVYATTIVTASGTPAPPRNTTFVYATVTPTETSTYTPASMSTGNASISPTIGQGNGATGHLAGGMGVVSALGAAMLAVVAAMV